MGAYMMILLNPSDVIYRLPSQLFVLLPILLNKPAFLALSLLFSKAKKLILSWRTFLKSTDNRGVYGDCFFHFLLVDDQAIGYHRLITDNLALN